MLIFIANVIVMTAIAFQLYRSDDSLKQFFWPALVLKILAGMALGLLYKFYYIEGDTFDYFQDGSYLAALARRNVTQYLQFLWDNDIDRALWDSLNFQQPRAIFFAKICSLFCLLTADHYWLVSAWLSLISFAGSWILISELTNYRRQLRIAAIFAFLLFPSVVFWTSGVVKECLAMGMIYLIVTVFLKLWQRKKIAYRWYVILPLSLWMLWSLKYYYLAILFPVLFAELVYSYFVYPRVARLSPLVRSLFWVGIFSFPLMVSGFIHPNIHPKILMQVVVENHDAFVEVSRKDNLIIYHDLRPEVFSIVANAPAAFVSGMFRPYLWEATNSAKFLAAVENALLLVLTLFLIYDLITKRRPGTDKAGWLIVIFSVLMCVFLALSAPNLGTLSRYRVGFLPFWTMLLVHNNTVLKKLTLRGKPLFVQ